MLRTIYEVVTSDNGWGIKRRGNLRNTLNFPTKSDAVAEGQRRCKAAKPSQLIIRKADGQIETEYTYGNDPVRSPG